MDTQQHNLFCPICKSSALSANQSTFNNTTATIGNMFGPQKGLLYGNMGPKKIIITCLSCGNTFKPGEGATETDFDQKHQVAVEKQEHIKSSRQTKRVVAFVLLILILLVMWGAWSSLTNQNSSDQSANTTTNVASSSTIGNKYVVTAQKASFYRMSANNGSWHKRRAYLVEGEKIVGLKQQDTYVYCEFTDSSTQKTTKGWISSMDIKKITDTVAPSSN